MSGADLADEGANHFLVIQFWRQLVPRDKVLEKGDNRPSEIFGNWLFHSIYLSKIILKIKSWNKRQIISLHLMHYVIRGRSKNTCSNGGEGGV